MSNPTYKVKVNATGEEIEVYKISTGTPTADHVWCKIGGLESCSKTYTKEELTF